MVDGRSTTGPTPLRRLMAGIVGATLIGALFAPAAAMAVVMLPVDDLITTTEDHAAVTGNVLANDTGVLRSAGLVISSTTPGILTVAENGDYSFTPAANWSGTNALLGWYLADADDLNNGNEVITYVRATVTAENDVPVATAQSLETDEDTDLPITLSGTDPEGATLSFEVVDEPMHGTLSGSGAARTYSPDPNYYGADSFTFKANDGTNLSAAATISIDVIAVSDVPTADDQTVNVAFETAEAITLTGADGDGDELAFTVLTTPTHGVLSGTAPDLTYTPDADYVGADSFTFKVTADGDDSAPATVSIVVAEDAVAPTVPAPTVAFGAGRVNESAPIRITWSATDAGVGVEGYVVEAKVGAGAWTQIYAGSDTTITKFYPFGQSLQWRVKASDANDNWSNFTNSAVRRLYAFQGSSPVAYSGSWTTVASSSSSGVNYKYTTTSGKYVKLSFTNAIGVIYVAPKTSAGGYVKVKIDGTTYPRNDLRSTSTSYGVIIRGKAWGSAGNHTIWVYNAQGGRRANFDAFIVLK